MFSLRSTDLNVVHARERGRRQIVGGWLGEPIRSQESFGNQLVVDTLHLTAHPVHRHILEVTQVWNCDISFSKTEEW